MGLANIHKRFGNENYIIIRHTKSVPESVPGSVPGSVPDSENVKHKEIIIRKNGNQLKVSDYIERFDRGCTLLDQYTYTEITEDTLKNEHKYLDVLFSSLDQKPKPKTFTERFTSSKSKLKWFVREALLDTTLVGGLVGKIIAFSANRENPHYTTIASRILAKTLGPLIFPAGYKAATVSENVISVDAIIHKQLKALKNYTGEHRGIEFENIEGVTVKLGNRELNLTTIAAENKIKPHEGGQPLHIIYFNGNSGCFEQDYKQVAEDLLVYETDKKAVKAIMFNYPGVLCPDGTQRVERAQDLVDAGIAQVERLLDDGVLEENIVLHGVSLGGSVASHVAAHFNAEGTPLAGVYASRTFASTAQVGKNFFNRALGNNIFSKFISTICLPFIKLGTGGQSGI